MKKIVLISCVKKKRPVPCAAIDFYDSPWFQKARDYGSSLHPDEIYILSAKYGLARADQMLCPYDETLNAMNSMQRKAWAEKVLAQMKNAGIDFNDEVIFLAGQKYRENLIQKFANAVVPLRGLGIGKQLQFMKNRI